MARDYEPRTLIHNWLDKQRMSQRIFAEYMGVDAPTVSTWCSGKRMPNPESTKKMAEILQVDVDYLQGYLIALNVWRNYSPSVAIHAAAHIKRETEDRFMANLGKENE